MRVLNLVGMREQILQFEKLQISFAEIFRVEFDRQRINDFGRDSGRCKIRAAEFPTLFDRNIKILRKFCLQKRFQIEFMFNLKRKPPRRNARKARIARKPLRRGQITKFDADQCFAFSLEKGNCRDRVFAQCLRYDIFKFGF